MASPAKLPTSPTASPAKPPMAPPASLANPPTELMAPGVNQIAEQVVSEMLPAGGVNGALLDVGKARLRALPAGAAGEL